MFFFLYGNTERGYPGDVAYGLGMHFAYHSGRQFLVRIAPGGLRDPMGVGHEISGGKSMDTYDDIDKIGHSG